MAVLYSEASDSFCTLILAHGAGAPMDSEFMEAVTGFFVSQVVRFEFPYMTQRRIDGIRRPPNKMNVLQDTWRCVYEQVREVTVGPIVLAGKSMGARVASMLVDELQVSALVCFGYPFYPAKKPEKPRIAHLLNLKTPTLIVQGERDALGGCEVVAGYELSASIDIFWLPFADHDLKPLKRSGFTHEAYLQSAVFRAVSFIKESLG